MLSTNFIETAKNAMNELAETNRNIGLLETSISMQSFSAVASETQADAAEMMIAEETGRKRQLITHLSELLQESHERSSEAWELYKSANDEESYYAERVKHFQAARDFVNADICVNLKTKAALEGTRYLQEYSKLNALSLSISNTIREEQSSRLLPLTTIDDLPFESAKPAENILDTFERLVKAHPQQVIDYIADHRMVSDTVDAAICEITSGRVNVEDVMQSFDEVLEDEYFGFYEALNSEYAVNPKMYQKELAACVEAYAE